METILSFTICGFFAKKNKKIKASGGQQVGEGGAFALPPPTFEQPICLQQIKAFWPQMGPKWLCPKMPLTHFGHPLRPWHGEKSEERERKPTLGPG